MSELVIARRYASALLDCVKDNKEVDSVLAQVIEARDSFKASTDLTAVLTNPFISLRDKLELMKKLVKKMKLGSTVANFFLVLTKNERILQLDAIIKEFRVLIAQRLKREDAQVISAQELSEGEKKDLQKSLQKMLDLELNLFFKVDESLLGGFLVQTRNNIYDYSVKGQLSRLTNLVAKIKV